MVKPGHHQRRDDASHGNVAAVVEALAPLARPLESDADLESLLDRIGDARFVLLGEASHGTAEFYAWRTRLTKRLVRDKGFRFVAVEGDWPDCARLDRYVRGKATSAQTAREALQCFARWPTWMWANREVESLVEWLHDYNQRRAPRERVAFHGLDVYSLWDSMAQVVAYLERVDPEAARRAKNAYECFAPFAQDEQEYARATALVPASCENDVVRALVELRMQAANAADRDAYFDAEQNAITAKDAELYYRTMVQGGASSWNVRDLHMVETLERLVQFHGPDARAIVWAHNTHIGDARFTDMARAGELNVGQLVRERHAEEGVVLVGFSSYRGSVLAAEEWGAKVQRMNVPAAREGSWEDALHRLGGDRLVLMPEAEAEPCLLEPRGHRAIGVVYRPQLERFANYVPSFLPRRYDALLHIDHSHALMPLHDSAGQTHGIPETYPSGM